MKPQLPALVMPLSTTETAVQAGGDLEGHPTLPGGGFSTDPISAAHSKIYVDNALRGRAPNISSYLQSLIDLKWRMQGIFHTTISVRNRKKRFG